MLTSIRYEWKLRRSSCLTSVFLFTLSYSDSFLYINYLCLQQPVVFGPPGLSFTCAIIKKTWDSETMSECDQGHWCHVNFSIKIRIKLMFDCVWLHVFEAPCAGSDTRFSRLYFFSELLYLEFYSTCASSHARASISIW